MPRSRDELVRLLEAHKAAVAALKAEINRRALEAYEVDRSADTWRLAIGTVSASISHDAATVTDPEAFYRWLAARRPDAVKVETVTVYRPWNAKWVTDDFLPSLTPVDDEELEPGQSTQLCDAQGELVPGVMWTMGGRFLHASFKPKAGVQEVLAKAAERYAAGGRMPELDS